MITRKDLQRYKKVFCLGYCELQQIFNGLYKTGYNAGVYGWNYNAYQFGANVITTGYRPTGERLPDEIIKKYKAKIKKAEQIVDWAEREKGFEKIRVKFHYEIAAL